MVLKARSHERLRHRHHNINLWAAPLIFLTVTVTGRMGCLPILPVNVT